MSFPRSNKIKKKCGDKRN